MTKQTILNAIQSVATDLYNAHKPDVIATWLLTSEDAELISITDVDTDQETWKVINGLTDWINKHYVSNTAKSENGTLATMTKGGRTYNLRKLPRYYGKDVVKYIWFYAGCGSLADDSPAFNTLKEAFAWATN